MTTRHTFANVLFTASFYRTRTRALRPPPHARALTHNDATADENQGCSALHRACAAALPGAVQALLDGGAESVGDYALNLPVHYAILAGGADGLECVRILR